MRRFNIIFYILGVFLNIIGFIMYNYDINNDRELIAAALLIGIGTDFLICSYL